MSKNEIKNRGLILEPQSHKAWQFGGISGIASEDRIVLKEDGQWLDSLPTFEPQSNTWVDAMDCVTMSAHNCIETHAKLKGIDLNLADRFTANLSGTTHGGNSFGNVWDSIVKYNGVVPEELWPFTPDIKTWEDFYKDIPQEVKDIGQESLKTLKIRYEYVPTSSLTQSLKYSPVQIAIYAYPQQGADGVYVATTKKANHAVMLCGYVQNKYWLIFDSYENNRDTHDGQVKKLAWNTKIAFALLPTIIQLNSVDNYNYMKLEEKVIYQLVEAPGGFFWRLGDVVYKLSSAEDFEAARSRFESATISTNKGSRIIQIPKNGTVTKEDMEGITYRNMKGEILGTF